MEKEQWTFYEGPAELPPEIPSEETLLAEIAPYDGDPIATRQHIDKRLHNAMEALARNAEKGDIQSARALVAVAERRAKMLGLDAPKEVQVDVTRRRDPDNLKSYTTAELYQMLAEMQAIPGQSERVKE